MVYKERIKKVKGKKDAEVLLFALSTCGWCRRAKDLLNSLGIEYSYVDVDLLDDEDIKEVEDILNRFNSNGFPTIIIDNKDVVHGFDEDKIKKAVKKNKK